jgi:nicotinamide mononucleotide transporter
MDWLQIFTLITGVLYIVLEIRQKSFMWVVGIATSLAAMWVFFRQGLYASFGLNTYYFITAFIGLWQWRRDKKLASDVIDAGKPDRDVIVLNRLTWKIVAVSAAVCVLMTVSLSVGMSAMHDLGILDENPMSLLDSAVTALSVVATWWLVRSYLEQWWLWVFADLMSTYLCASQGMWWMALLYLVYAASAVYGLKYWKERGTYLLD